MTPLQQQIETDYYSEPHMDEVPFLPAPGRVVAAIGTLLISAARLLIP